MKQTQKGPTPFLLSLFLIPMLMSNLIIFIYPLLIEGIIIRAPVTLLTSEFDIWLVESIFGSFTYNNYVLVLLGSYLFSFTIGGLTASILLWPIFRKLLNANEVVIRERELGMRTVLDMLIGVFWFSLCLIPYWHISLHTQNPCLQ